MVLHGIELQHTEFHGISLYSIVLHGITWFWFVLHGIVCWTLCSITYFRYVKLWGLARRVFTLFESFPKDSFRLWSRREMKVGGQKENRWEDSFHKSNFFSPQQWEFQQSNDVIKKVFGTGYEFQKF